jgi:hypothetical protein
VDNVARLVLAFAAGASLVVLVLVLVMSLKKGVLKSLITMSVAVVLFAICLAFGVKAGNTETLAATAAYAAVLVVFVGTSRPGEAREGNDKMPQLDVMFRKSIAVCYDMNSFLKYDNVKDWI